MAGAPPKRGVFLLLLLLPGVRSNWTSPPPPPWRLPPLPATVVALGGPPGCGGGALLQVTPGPPSVTAAPGTPVTLRCRFRAPAGAGVTWHRACPRRGGGSCGAPQEVSGGWGGATLADGGATLAFAAVTRNHSGVFFCRVRSGPRRAQTCGTVLRVAARPPEPLVPLSGAARARLVAALGTLLLVAAAAPGALLLLQKRRGSERLLPPKASAPDDENLYEGLNVAECSMYEDISRGGAQPTYQDVGSLEKP